MEKGMIDFSEAKLTREKVPVMLFEAETNKKGTSDVFTGSPTRENTVHITYLKVNKQQAGD